LGKATTQAEPFHTLKIPPMVLAVKDAAAPSPAELTAVTV
jgi:hypothetical protein